MDTRKAVALDTRIIKLKDEGLSFRQIAVQVDHTLSYVYRCYQRGLRRIIAPVVEEYRARQLAEIEAERALLEEIVHAVHPLVSQGHIVSEIVDNDEDGKPVYGDPLVDDGPVLAALDRLRRLRDQEQDLLGLKMPTKVEATGQVRVEIVGVDPEELL